MQKLNAQVKGMQAELSKVSPANINAQRRLFNQNANLLRDYATQAVTAKSATQAYTEALAKQEIGLGRAIKSRQMFNAVLQEQYRLQRMTTIEWTKNAAGTMTADIIVPKGVSQEVGNLTSSLGANVKALVAAKIAGQDTSKAMDVLKMRFGLFNQTMMSVSKNMINWGKNTQWAGRQLTVGLGVPLAAFAAVAGITAYHVNQALTRISKVYDTTATTLEGKTRELNDLQQESMRMGTQVAKLYGASLQDTLDVEAELAATGLKNQQLLESTAQVQRASILGELDKQSTIKATIALQSVYRLNSNQLADAFNYMNATENATNLTMQDFVETIPRASGPLHQLGVTLQETGVLMAAMKSRGIEASVGANALRSGIYRLLNPTPAAIKMMKGFNISLTDIVKNAKGNFYKALLALSQQMKGLSRVQIQQGIGKVFGIQRAGQITAIIQGLGDIHDKTTQVGRAFEVAGQSTEAWANVAQGEMNQIRQSLSGKLKIAIESFKAQLASMGQPLLKVAKIFVDTGTGLLKFFNSLPKGLKMFLLIGAGLTALAGVGIMLTGVFANMIGQILKVGSTLASMLTPWKAMTAEQRAAQMLSKQTSAAWENEGVAAQALTGSIQILTRNLQTLIDVQRGYTLMPAPGGGVMRSYNVPGTPNYGLKGQFASNAEIQEFNQRQKIASEIESSSEKTARNWGLIGSRVAGLGIGVGLMGTMVSQSGSLLSKISNVVFISSLIGPTLVKGISRIMTRGGLGSALGGIGSAIGGIGKAFSAGRAEGGIVTGLKAALPVAGELSMTLGRLFGPVGIIATGGFMFLKAWQKQKALVAAQEKINNSAQDWANIMGFVYEDYRKISQVQDQNAPNAVDQAAISLAKTNPDLVERVKLLKEQGHQQELVNEAIYEGIKAYEHGASPSAANAIVRTVLRASGLRTTDINAMMVDIMKRIKFGDNASVVKNAQEQFAILWRRALGGGNQAVNSSLVTGFAKEWSNIFNNLPTPQGKLKMFDKLKAQVEQSGNTFFANLPRDIAAIMKKNGITSWADLMNTDVMAEQGNGPANAIMGQLRAAGIDWNRMKGVVNNEKTLAKAIATANGATKDQVAQINQLSDVTYLLDMPLNTVKNAQMQYNSALESARTSHEHLNKAQKLALLNYYRVSAGLSKATSLEQGFGDAVDNTTGKTDKNSRSLKINADALSKLTSAMQSAYSGAQDAAINRADELWQERADAATAAIQKTANQATRAVTRAAHDQNKVYNQQMRDLNHHFNSQIRAINKEINAEEKANQKRQDIFEAEKQRLQEAADLANQNIDFNAAIDLGNLDEAAKISNDMQAAAQQSAIDQASKQAQGESDARVKHYQNEIRNLKKLQKEQTHTLQKEIDRYNKGIEAQKRAIARKEQRDEAANQKFLADQKATLDLELAAIQANIPKNEAQYQNHISRIEKLYAKYGLDLQSYGAQWGGYVGQALDSNVKAAAAGLKNDIKWQNIGNEVANRFTKGALGLTIGQFAKWITTGQLPKGGLNPGKTGNINQQGGVGSQPYGPPSHHAGGIVGKNDNRAGRSRSAGMSRDEILIRAQKGEYIVNAAAHKAVGTDYLNNINAGSKPMGLVGLAGGALAGMLTMAVAKQITDVAQSKSGGFGAGLFQTLGNLGNVIVPQLGSVGSLSAEQLHNAAIIMGVGRAMGGSKRDLIVGLMTSLMESRLHNLHYGDRDSLGLFQQRPSQGWGTPAQILNPQHASRQFFSHLFAYPERNKWPLWKEAQEVQRSAYPHAYASWEDLARQIVASAPHMLTGGEVQYDNTIANLHKGEKVLTAPLSRDLEHGIRNLDQNPSVEYTIKMDFDGAHFESEIDVEKAVVKAISKIERKSGPVRRIRD